MPLVAITGPICSGKTTVLEILKRKGAKIYNTDYVVHTYYKNRNSEVYKSIVKVFPQVLNRDKSISRRRLREIVFSQPESLEKLERIVHPRVIGDLKRWLGEAKKKEGIHIAEVPLLFQKGLEGWFDKVIFVDAPQNVLLRRIARKFKISFAQARKRLNIFKSRETMKEKSDFVVYNNVSKKELKKRLEVLWDKLVTGC